MTITPMRGEHVPAIAAIERKSFSQPWSESAVRMELANPVSHYFVAAEDGAVLGYIGLHDVWGEGYITNVAVASEHRRQRIGAALVEHIVDYGRAHRLDFITLEVRESNAAARHLYESFGFLIVGRRPQFYSEPVEDALLMTLFLKEMTA